MRSIILAYLLGTGLSVTAPVFAGFALSVDANYASLTNHRTSANGASSDLTAPGNMIIASARFEFPVLSLLSLGLGGYGTVGSLYPGLTGGATADVVTGFGFGGDIWLTLETNLPIKPFARIMAGRFSAEEQVTFSLGSSTLETVQSSSGLQYNIAAGVRFPFLAILEAYAQAGYSGTGNNSPSLKSATMNGSPIAVNYTANTTYATGFIIGGGLMLKF